MRTYFLLLANLFTTENKVNISKNDVLLKCQHICPNVKFVKKWSNKTGFGVENRFSNVNYYNNVDEEIAIINFKKYSMKFTLIDTKDSNTILKFSSNVNNIFTRYIGDFYVNIHKKANFCNYNNIPDLFEHYNNWVLKYQT